MKQNIVKKAYKKVRKSQYYFPTMKRLYTLMRIVLPINQKLIVFESNVGKSIGDSPKNIYDQLQLLDADYKYVWICNHSNYNLGKNTKIVGRLGIKYYYYLARAKYWVNNQNFPSYLVKPEGTTYLQTWHGTPLKRMQNDLDVVIGRDATYLERVNFASSQWDYLVSPSSYASEKFKTAFNFKHQMLEVGYPRNDIFYSEENYQEAIKKITRHRLGLKGDPRKIILYAPTFRDDSLNNFDLTLDLAQFVNELSDDYVLLIRGHLATSPKMSNLNEFKKDIIDVSKYPDIQELFLISDACITDYSSVMFDFAHTRRPLLFFVYDLDHYKDNLRGFYIDFISEAPGPLSKTTEELIQHIKDLGNASYDAKYQDFYDKYCYLEDGTSAKKVVEEVFSLVTQEDTRRQPDYVTAKIANDLSAITNEKSLEMTETDQGCYLNFHDNIDVIYLGNSLEKVKINAQNGVFFISETLFQDWLELPESFLLYDESNNPLQIFKLTGSGLCLLFIHDQPYVLYKNELNQLVLEKRENINAKGYYYNDRIISMVVHDYKLSLELEVSSTVVPLVNGELVITTEEDDRVTSIQGEVLKREPTKRGIFKTSYSFEVDFEEMCTNDKERSVPVFKLSFEGSLNERMNVSFSIPVNYAEEPKSFKIDKADSRLRFIQYYCKKQQFYLKTVTISREDYIANIVTPSFNNKSYLANKNIEDIDSLSEADLFFYKFNHLHLERVDSEDIKATTTNDGFLLATNRLFKELYVTDGHKKRLLKKKDNLFFLSIRDVNGILMKNGSLKIVDEENNRIAIDNYHHLVFDGPSTVKKGLKTYYLYKSVDNFLRVSKNMPPYYKSYYSNHSTDGIFSNGEMLSVYLTIRTNTFAVSEVAGKIKLRGESQHCLTDGEVVKITKLDSGYYESQVKLDFSSDAIYRIVKTKESKIYSYDIFDFQFSFNLEGHNIVCPFINILYGDTVNDTVSLDLDLDNKMVVFLYPTIIGQRLASKITLIEDDVYSCYESILDGNFSPINQDKKPLILVSEYPHKAQDTGLTYFKYLVDHHSDEFRVFYIISEVSKDLDNLKGYEEHIVWYRSKEHVQLFFEADIIASSHGTNYLCPVVDTFCQNELQSKYRVFLQHGILGVRDMSNLYGKKKESPFTNLFVTSSYRERDLVVRDFGYDEEEVVVSGLPRFDRLFSNMDNIGTKQIKKVVIMPSWREGLNNKDPEDFMKSQFYRVFQSLINNPILKGLVDTHHFDIGFYLHTNFQKFAECFESDFVTIIQEGSKTVQDYLIESDVLITDYSSVGLDFAIMEKPIIYYQFDTSIKNKTGDLTYNFFPGEIIRTESELIAELTYLIENPGMRDDHKNKLDNLYTHRDNKANDRIYEAMRVGYESSLIDSID